MALPVQINPKHNKSTLERVCFYYEENFIRGLLRGCIGGASLNCINLVVPMNPCPCGYYPDIGRCRCTPYEIKRYLGRVSGPILDRIDLCVEVQPMEFKDITVKSPGESSEQIRDRVMQARKVQEIRFAGTELHFNADMGAGEVERYCTLGEQEQNYMEKVFSAMQLSARAYHRTLKVARTIADLDGQEQIRERHLAEAICYRQADTKYW